MTYKHEYYLKNKDRMAAQTKAARDRRLIIDPDWQRNQQKNWLKKDPRRLLLKGARDRANKKKLPFDLSLEDIFVPEICPVLGIPLFRGEEAFMPNSPSLDRIIPDKGYVRENVRVISNRANVLKRDATLEELKKLVLYLEREIHAF